MTNQYYSNLPLDEAVTRLNSVETVTLTYGSINTMGEREALDEMIHRLAAEPPELRQRIAFSVDRKLRKRLPKIQSGKFSKKVADEFYYYQLIWGALKRTGTII
jgi:hypothetical protein